MASPGWPPTGQLVGLVELVELGRYLHGLGLGLLFEAKRGQRKIDKPLEVGTSVGHKSHAQLAASTGACGARGLGWLSDRARGAHLQVAA